MTRLCTEPNVSPSGNTSEWSQLLCCYQLEGKGCLPTSEWQSGIRLSLPSCEFMSQTAQHQIQPLKRKEVFSAVVKKQLVFTLKLKTRRLVLASILRLDLPFFFFFYKSSSPFCPPVLSAALVLPEQGNCSYHTHPGGQKTETTIRPVTIQFLSFI
jgi:hypothetical protein